MNRLERIFLLSFVILAVIMILNVVFCQEIKPVIEVGSAKIKVDEEAKIAIVLKNAPFAVGVSVKLRFDPSIVNVVDVKAGEFTTLVSGLFTKSIDNTKGIVGIAIAGTKECVKVKWLLLT